MIITANAPIDVAAAGAVTAAFHLTGQICTSAERFFVVDEIHDRFVEAFARETARLRLGNGLERSEIGPLVSEAARAKVTRLVGEAVDKGASVVIGGRVPPALPKGWFYELTDPDPAAPRTWRSCRRSASARWRRSCASPTSTRLRLANDSPFGLGGSIFTTSLEEAMEAADRLEAGMV